jgi:hypothetical protein
MLLNKKLLCLPHLNEVNFCDVVLIMYLETDVVHLIGQNLGVANVPGTGIKFTCLFFSCIEE